MKNKDLDLQLLPTKLTDHAIPPLDSPMQPTALPRIQSPAPLVASLPVPCAPVCQQVAPPLQQSPQNHPSSHCTAHAQPATPMTTLASDTPHWALHGNAFNPDTGELAKYSELSHSSNGHLWHASNTTEIHHLAQGTPAIPRTNTMHFIAITQLPPGTKATYLCVVCAFCPEKDVPHSALDCGWQLC